MEDKIKLFLSVYDELEEEEQSLFNWYGNVIWDVTNSYTNHVLSLIESYEKFRREGIPEGMLDGYEEGKIAVRKDGLKAILESLPCDYLSDIKEYVFSRKYVFVFISKLELEFILKDFENRFMLRNNLYQLV